MDNFADLAALNSERKKYHCLPSALFGTMLLILALPITSSMSYSVGCPNGCECNDDTYVVKCERNKVDVVPITLNPAIQRLVLRYNKIKTVDGAAFQFYKDLQYVDLSSNHLVSIPKQSFSQQEKLQELHLNKNKISILNSSTFQGLKSLTVLSLRENFIEELSADLFGMLPKLEELNIGQNRISKIDPYAFKGLSSLRVLYLDDNALKTVPTISFSLLGSLAELHIGLNSFSYITDDAFSKLNTLSILDVSSAGLSNISENAFRSLINLRILNLIDNQLQHIPTQQLRHLKRLEELIIGQNSFVSIGKNALKGLSNLRKIDITGASNLRIVERGAFAENLNLEVIILANNLKLEILEDESLVGLPNLKHLVLKDNSFQSFSESSVSWNELRTLEIANNPIHCDCQLLWLTKLMYTKNITNVQCATPLGLHNRSLRTLDSDELDCSSFRDPRHQAILVTLCVSAVILLGGLAVLMFRYRQKVRESLKDYKWNKRAISRKEHEYQKTFSEDEYVIRATAAAAVAASAAASGSGQYHTHFNHHTNNIHHNNIQPYNNHHLGIIMPIPVTEL